MQSLREKYYKKAVPEMKRKFALKNDLKIVFLHRLLRTLFFAQLC